MPPVERQVPIGVALRHALPHLYQCPSDAPGVFGGESCCPQHTGFTRSAGPSGTPDLRGAWWTDPGCIYTHKTTPNSSVVGAEATSADW